MLSVGKCPRNFVVEAAPDGYYHLENISIDVFCNNPECAKPGGLPLEEPITKMQSAGTGGLQPPIASLKQRR